MPPVSREQQKLVYARARAGEAWAQRWIKEGKAQHIVPKKMSARDELAKRYVHRKKHRKRHIGGRHARRR